MTFEEWWADALPSQMKKGSKPRAKSRYSAIEKAGELGILNASLQEYMKDQRDNSWRSWLMAPSFLGRFKEWATEERTEALADDGYIGYDEMVIPHKHYCKGCGTGHDWQCSDPDCIYPGHALCSQAVKSALVSR